MRRQRQKPLRSRKHLRPISDKHRAEREAKKEAQGPLARAWYETVAKGKVCVVCASPKRVQGHHVISQEAIRKYAGRYSLDLEALLALLWDKRNGIPVCEHDHSRHTSAKKRIPLSVIPLTAFEFADELGLRWQIERDYPDDPAGRGAC